MDYHTSAPRIFFSYLMPQRTFATKLYYPTPTPHPCTGPAAGEVLNNLCAPALPDIAERTRAVLCISKSLRKSQRQILPIRYRRAGLMRLEILFICASPVTAGDCPKTYYKIFVLCQWFRCHQPISPHHKLSTKSEEHS